MILIHDIPLASTIPAQQTVDRVLSFKVPTLDHWNHPRDTRDTADWLAVNICKHIWNEFKHLQTMFYHVFIVVFCFLMFYHSLSLHGSSFPVLLCLLATFSYLGDLVSRQPSAQRMAASPPWPWQFQRQRQWWIRGTVLDGQTEPKQKPNRNNIPKTQITKS